MDTRSRHGEGLKGQRQRIVFFYSTHLCDDLKLIIIRTQRCQEFEKNTEQERGVWNPRMSGLKDTQEKVFSLLTSFTNNRLRDRWLNNNTEHHKH